MEFIKDRLAHIMRAKNLTATQFAEMMQIQPSNVSHLLSGRNKPSLDFLIKLKDNFPEYSFDWIILGKKPITVSERLSDIKDDKSRFVESSQSNENIAYEGLFELVEDNTKEIQEAKQENLNSDFSKKIKQIIYIYEDNTFEIYDSRK